MSNRKSVLPPYHASMETCCVAKHACRRLCLCAPHNACRMKARNAQQGTWPLSRESHLTSMLARMSACGVLALHLVAPPAKPISLSDSISALLACPLHMSIRECKLSGMHGNMQL